MAEQEIIIGNQLDQIAVLAEALERLSDEWNIPMGVTLNLNLVLEELVSNIIFYGYDDTNQHIINILLSFDNDTMKMRIEDDGKEFNPLLYAEADINLSIEDRKIGGLGIFFVRKMMDEIHYERRSSKNILNMSKRISPTV
jgi:serine/threonine-protein kinase RsbW